MHLIHVDRDDECRARVRRALEGVGVSVTGVATPAAAVTALEEAAADGVVTDHRPPSVDARRLLGRLRDVDPSVPVAVYTDTGSESLAGALTAAGVDVYVPKADGPDVLADRVGSLVAAGDGGHEAGTPTTVAPATDERLSLLVEQAPMGIVEWDLDFRAVAWNGAAESLFGYDRSEALGRTAWDLVVPESAEEAVVEAWSRLHEDEGVDHVVTEAVAADGDRLTCEWHASHLEDEAGDPVGVLAFVRDVTGEARRARQMEALQRATRDMMGADTRRAVAETVVGTAEAVLDQPVASVRLLDEDRGVLETVATSERTEALLSDIEGAPRDVGPGDGSVWDAYAAGEAVIHESLAPAETVYGDALPVRSVLFQPLGDHGVLVFGADQADAFDEADVHMASILANTAVAAMDTAVRSRELARAERILEAAGDGVFAISPEERYVEANDRFLELTGYDRETVVGAGPSLFLTEEAHARARESVRPLLEGDADVVTYETTIERADGSSLPVEVSQSLLPDGEFAASVGTVRDISDRRSVEEALREREAKIERLHRVAAQLDGCDHPDDVCRVTAGAARRILNFDFCAVGVVDDGDLVARAAVGEGASSWVESRVPASEGLAGRCFEEQRTVRRDDVADDARKDPGAFRSVLSVPLGDQGVMQAVSTDKGAFDDEDAELAELLAAHATDALERAAFEAELRTGRDRMAALFDNVPDPVVRIRHTDDGPVVEAVNAAFEQAFGFDAETLRGEVLDDYIVPQGHEEQARRLDERGRRGELVESEVKRRTVDGIREFRLTIVPIDLDGDQQEAYGVYTDVTDRKQRRERVEVLNRVLRHDLRNVLNVVRGEAEEIADAASGDPAERAARIVEQSDDLLALADRTRALERAFDGGDGRDSSLDVAAFLRRAISEVEETYPDAAVSLDGPGSAVVRGGSLLELALFDVVENAVVHNDRPEPSVDVDVTVERDTVVVSVADDGPGIPEAERRLLAGDEQITQLRHASGLGLWMVHWAVSHGGGELSFADNEPRGSVVTIRLPRAPVR